MIKEDMIITLEDNKDYYVMASLMNNEDNYIMIGEIDKEKEEISDNVKIMYYDTENNMVRKVTNPNALFQLTKLFAKQKQELDGIKGDQLHIDFGSQVSNIPNIV